MDGLDLRDTSGPHARATSVSRCSWPQRQLTPRRVVFPTTGPEAAAAGLLLLLVSGRRGLGLRPRSRSCVVAFSAALALPLPPPVATRTEFSVLSPNIPWEVEDIWRTFAAFGGLGVVAELLHCPSLDPLTTVSSTVVLQLAELTLALALLQLTAKKDHKLWAFFQGRLYPQHSWVKETVLGLIFLMTMVSLTTVVADRLIGIEDTYDPMLREILSDSPTSRLLCFFLYCVIAPLSEETIYRGFLLTALSSSMKWKDAVIVSSLMFSIAHFSINSSFQLFVIGCITGLAYSRTGTLAAPLTIHSLYNAAIFDSPTNRAWAMCQQD
uniref:CAAX prenyl protease 2/Lysostaphin resistance protein A-like domain-containing protein n=1 Tax=Oryza punctata TaxID=4537 RepID=A0A0E0LK70_ORYPU